MLDYNPEQERMDMEGRRDNQIDVNFEAEDDDAVGDEEDDHEVKDPAARDREEDDREAEEDKDD